MARERAKTKKYQKNMLKIIGGEPVTEESDSMMSEDIEQAVGDVVGEIATTDPARLGGMIEDEEKVEEWRSGLEPIRTNDPGNGFNDGEAPERGRTPAAAAPAATTKTTPTPEKRTAVAGVTKAKLDPPSNAPKGWTEP